MLLSKREREFIQDWLRVLNGEMNELEFYSTWAIKRRGRNFQEDVKALKEGRMTPEEFMRKWGRGEWKIYVRTMKYRLKKKLEKSKKDFELLKQFFKAEKLP